MLGFIKRVTHKFTDSRTLNSLYNALVRSRLDYCSQVWSPADKTAIGKLESVQKRYFKYLCYKQKVMYYDFDYPSLCFILNMKSLENRRKVADQCFLNKLMQNKVNCPYLVNQLSLQVTQRIVTQRIVQDNPTFATNFRLLCRKNSFMPRSLAIANQFSLYDDLIMKPPTEFKSFIKTIF